MFHRRKQSDFSDELESHLALEANLLREQGLSEEEARRTARLHMGNLMNHEERFYESSRWMWLEHFRQDVRYAFRQLRRAPAFAVTAILTLAIGIGATTSIFTLIHAVLLKSLPVDRPEQLYGIGDTKHGGVYSGMAGNWGIFSYDLYQYFREHTEGFEELAAMQGDPRRIGARRAGSPDAAESYYGEYVSGNYFHTFGVRAIAGRTLTPEDDRKSAPPVAMMAYRVWEQKFALDPSIIGAKFNLNGASVTIAGVTPPEFFGDTLRPNPPDFFMPLALEPQVNHMGWVDNVDLHWLYVMGRIKPGADPRQIESQMIVELRQWLTSRDTHWNPAQRSLLPEQTLHLLAGASGIGSMRANYTTSLQLLMAISAFVLLIACANMANLMLVRALERKRQVSISLALGAARFRVVRQTLTESLVLALIGGAGGVVVAFAGTRTLLSAVFTGATAVPISPNPDLTVLLFALTVSCVTGLLFGIAPAWAANHADPIDALRGSGRSSAKAGTLPQRLLVVLQAAVSLVLLASAGLLMQSLRNLENQKLGFEPAGRMAIRIDPNLAGYKIDQLEPLYRNIKDRLSQIPGVISASYSLYSPRSGSSWTTQVFVDGHPAPVRADEAIAAWTRVGPDYFDTAGTRILRGRPITEADTATTRHVAVVSETFARSLFNNEEDPMGRHFGVTDAKYSKNYEIVGIAEDAKYFDVDQATHPMYYLPRSQTTAYSEAGIRSFEARSLYANDVVLRVAGRDPSLGEKIRRAFAEIDPNLTVIRILTFDQQVNNSVSQQALIARLTSVFGLTALLLATIGLYGVTAYAVQRRSKEIGIRVALGADRRAVLSMVIRSALLLVGIGLAIGIPLSLMMNRLLDSKLYGVSGHNPVVLGGAVVVLAAFAFAAVIIPARRATSIDPIMTLRFE
jgi:putative ABC transport system permease protein